MSGDHFGSSGIANRLHVNGCSSMWPFLWALLGDGPVGVLDCLVRFLLAFAALTEIFSIVKLVVPGISIYWPVGDWA